MSNFGQLIFGLPPGTKKLIRTIERTNRKLAKAHNSLVYNETCIKEDILPKYTNLKLHDPAAKETSFTKEYRKNLVVYQIECKRKVVQALKDELQKLHDELSACQIDDIKRQQIERELESSFDNAEHSNKIKIIKKLSKLYGGDITLPESKDGYINLSSIELTENQKQILNLSLNCHYQNKYDLLDKKAELEVLYQDLLKLQKEKKILVDPNLKDSLVGESVKIRGRYKSKILSRSLFQAAKELREDDRIVVRRADKSAVIVIIDKNEYLEKMNAILSDDTKFEKISKDPTDTLKAKVNRLITSANAVVGSVHFTKIVGEYAPGYAYGNIKTHKTDNPLRPIISQVPTPTYMLAKRLNTLLQPYLPTGHNLRSTEEFIDLLRGRQPSGILASIDVESLFTNVPVEETISIILDKVYNSSTLPPLQLSREILEKLLRACTTESPFRGPDGQLYRQKDGIAMGSPLGPLFANFYMCEVEGKLLEDADVAPNIYCRYVDDIFVDVRNEEHLHAIISKLESSSILKFTFELSVVSKLPFLDVMVKAQTNTFITSVHRKATDAGKCLNGISECPSRYKKSVIRAFIRRAVKVCSSWDLLHVEFTRIKQILVNNGYSNQEIDDEIRTYLDREIEKGNMTNGTDETNGANGTNESNGTNGTDDTNGTNGTNSGRKIRIFYRNQMSTAYKIDERVIRDIIYGHVKCVDENDRLLLVIYYRNSKTKDLLIRNNAHSKNDKLKCTNVVYRFSCPFEDCRLRDTSYIGATTTSLSRRLTMHLRDGAPKQHMNQEHHTTLTRKHLTENTDIIKTEHNKYRLFIAEALLIRQHTPTLNKQVNSCVTLGLWR